MFPIPLGPFEIHERVAQGGMGEIWRGVHRAQQVPVALKVMTGEAMQKAHYYEAFRREVQAVARLSHPHVAMVFEYGAISAETSRASGGALVEHSPYLVMEWAAHGSLDRLERPLGWRELRGVLLTLLDALAHAHARGVIHRDLKPQNVLLADAPRLDRAIKLADFGIARAQARESERRGHAVEAEGLTEAPAGTPYYMAPEQILGRFRDYGPWTDLYALGIVAWQLACGQLPFVADTLPGVFLLHLEQPLPPLRPRVPVPDAFEGWIRRMCEKAPRDRFRFAADAAWALSQIGEPTGSAIATPRVSTLVGDSGETRIASGRQHAAAPRASQLPGARPVLELAIESDDDRLPPQPAHWADAVHELPSMRLVGAGLGLWALRPVPLVDRDAERDALWEALRDVRLERKPRVVVLRGRAGTGKSRIAEWLYERAHEVGAAEVLAASHEAVSDRRHGLARLVERRFRCGGLDGPATIARIEEQLRADGIEDPYEWRALAGIVLGDEARTSIVPTTPAERHVLLMRMLARLTRTRPAIVWLDDVQWGEASLAFVQSMVDSPLAPPVLFVLTVRDEALAERPREQQQLATLEASPRTLMLCVGPLATDDVRRLAEQHLGLSAELARDVVARVQGNPLFAVQLVGDWIGKGLLAVGERGFVLHSGRHGDLPDDLHALWIGRVEQALSGRSALARVLVELGAVLGQHVDADEFARACAALGHRFPHDLLEPLILHRLVLPSERGWSFVHGLLRESLIRSAREQGRLPTLHRACAAMLEADVTRPGVAERLARHRLDAGDVAEALGPLLQAARRRLELSEIEAALALCAEREGLLASLGIAAVDPRAVEGQLVRAEAHRLHWDFDAAERVAHAALDAATLAGLVRERAEALAILAHCARQKGDLALAMSRNRTALGLFDRLGDARGHARTLLAMAAVARQQSDFARAEELYERSAAVFAAIGDDAGRASALLGLGNLHRVAQRWGPARASYEEARAMFATLGNQGNLAHCINGLAEVARFEGDLDAAERGYREVLRIQTAIGSKATFIPRTNLAIVLLARRAFAEARRELEEALAQIEKGGQRGYVAQLTALLLPTLAAANDAAEFDRRLAVASALLPETSTADPDVASAVELAGRLWLQAGDGNRARAAFAIARAQWSALGDERRVEALSRLLH